MSAICVDGLTLRFGTTLAIDRVSFAVAPGEVFGLVGESGSGKSTILRAITRLNSNWSGEITIDGRPVPHRPTRADARLVQMVFQDPYGSLHPRHLINATLMEPIRIHGLDRGDELIESALADVGLRSEMRYRFPHQLSGGQRQRVAIARALILEPRILLLDEPTSALDVSVQAEVLNLLADIRRERDLTMILVSHDLAVVATMCDRVGVMRAGKLVEIAASKDFARGQFESDYARQLLAASRGYDREMARRMALEQSA
jgi:peptide/nickel transport system ATP-binding protein